MKLYPLYVNHGGNVLRAYDLAKEIDEQEKKETIAIGTSYCVELKAKTLPNCIGFVIDYDRRNPEHQHKPYASVHYLSPELLYADIGAYRYRYKDGEWVVERPENRVSSKSLISLIQAICKRGLLAR